MDARAIIAQIRDGSPPPPDQIAWFAAGLASGTVSDAQAGAFALREQGAVGQGLSFAGAAAGPETLAISALVVFLGLKLPFLGLVFWIIMRQGNGEAHNDWSDRERDEIFAYLANQAQEAKGRPDEAERLQWLTREAWIIADTVPDEHRAKAVALAVEIGAMRPTPSGTTTPG
jgi:hypothetical protein